MTLRAAELRYAAAGVLKRLGRVDITPGEPVDPPTPPTGGAPGAEAGADVLGTTSYTIPGDGSARYVATTGSDAADGSVGTPWATLTHAVATAPTGATIVMRAGSYFEGGDTQGSAATTGIQVTKQLTIQNYPGEVVWLDGSRVASSWTAADGLWWTAYDRVFDRSPTNVRGADDTGAVNFKWVNPAYPLAPLADMALYDGTQLTPVATKAEVSAGEFWVEGANTGSGKWFAATKLWIGDNPSGHTVNVSDKVACLRIVGTGCVVRGIGIRRYSNSCPDRGVLLTERSDTVYENLHINDTAEDAITVVGSATQGWNCFIRKTSIERSGALGIAGRNADEIELDRVLIRTANRHRWNTSPQAGAIKITATQTVTLTKSLIDAPLVSKGFWCDQTVDTVTVTRNRFLNIPDKAVMLEVGSKGLVAGNVFDGCTSPIRTNNTDRVRIWNNTIVRFAERGVSWNQDTRRANNGVTPFNRDDRQPQSYYDLPENDWQINDLEFCNNVIAAPAAGAQSMLAIEDHQRSSGTARPFSAYHPVSGGNLYAWTVKPTYPWLHPSAVGGGVPAAEIKNAQTLAIYKTNTAAALGVSEAAGLEQGSTYSSSAGVIGADLAPTTAGIHNQAVALPADIAAALGVATGTKHVGAFL